MHSGCVLVVEGHYAGDCRFNNATESKGNARQNGICQVVTVVDGKSCKEAGLEPVDEQVCEAYCNSIEGTKKKGLKYNEKAFWKKDNVLMHSGCVLVVEGHYAGDCRFNNATESKGNARQNGICSR